MTTVIDLQRTRRRKNNFTVPIPDSACRILGITGEHDGNIHFRLSRCRDGVTVYFVMRTGRFIGFSWDASPYLGGTPKTFDEARKMVTAYLGRYGAVGVEVKKERVKRAVGEDRKLLKSGGCKESWLGSDVPELAGEAMSRCRSARMECGSREYCEYGTCDMIMDVVLQNDEQSAGATSEGEAAQS